MSSSAVVKERWGNAWEGHLVPRTPLLHHHHLRSEENPTAMWVELVLLGRAQPQVHLGLGLHQEAPAPALGGPDPRVRMPLPQMVPNLHTPPAKEEEEAEASVDVQRREQHIKSLPHHPGGVNKSWEDPTRSNVTCRDPTWTSPSPAVHSHLSSWQSRRAPGGALGGWAEGGQLLSSSDLCFSPALGGKREAGDVLPVPHATQSPW